MPDVCVLVREQRRGLFPCHAGKTVYERAKRNGVLTAPAVPEIRMRRTGTCAAVRAVHPAHGPAPDRRAFAGLAGAF